MDFMFTIKWIEASSIIIIIVIVNLSASFSHALYISACVFPGYTLILICMILMILVMVA